MTKILELQRKEEKLQKELEQVRKEQQRLKQLPPEVVLENLYINPELRGKVAKAVYEMTGNDRNRAASILRIPVSQLHKDINSLKKYE